jgi:hypothetical protein
MATLLRVESACDFYPEIDLNNYQEMTFKNDRDTPA